MQRVIGHVPDVGHRRGGGQVVQDEVAVRTSVREREAAVDAGSIGEILGLHKAVRQEIGESCLLESFDGFLGEFVDRQNVDAILPHQIDDGAGTSAVEEDVRLHDVHPDARLRVSLHVQRHLGRRGPDRDQDRDSAHPRTPSRPRGRPRQPPRR